MATESGTAASSAASSAQTSIRPLSKSSTSYSVIPVLVLSKGSVGIAGIYNGTKQPKLAESLPGAEVPEALDLWISLLSMAVIF